MDVIVYVLIYKKRNTNRRKQNRDERLPMAGMKRFIAYIYGYENAKRQAIRDLPGSSCGEKSAGLKSICVVSMLRRRTAGFICFANRVIRWREA